MKNFTCLQKSLIGILVIGILFTCVFIGVVFGMTAGNEDTSATIAPVKESVEVAIAEPTNTQRPASAPVIECKNLADFETLAEIVLERSIDFKRTNIGVWDKVWQVETPSGTYSILVVENGACLEQAGTISVFDLDYGNPDLAGALSGVVSGYFSTVSTDWYVDTITANCPYAIEQYDTTKTMSDGTLWEVVCEADYENNMLSVGLVIYPK